MKIDFSTRPLLIAILAAFSLWALVKLLERALWVIIVVFLALILTAAILPIVNVVRRVRFPPNGWRWPKAVIVLFIYLLVILLLAGLSYVIGRPLAGNILQLYNELPTLVQSIGTNLNKIAQSVGLPPGVLPSPQDLATHTQALLGPITQFIQTAAGAVVKFFVELFLVLALTLFLVIESDRVSDAWVSIFPLAHRPRVREVTDAVIARIGRWVLARGSIALITGTLGGLVAWLLGLPYAVLIGAVTGFLEAAPFLGPSIMAIPVFLIGLSQSLLIALLGAVFFYGLSELDGHVLSPLIEGQAVRLSPTAIIIVVPLGLALYGPIGALLAIPVAGGVKVILDKVGLPWLEKSRLEVPEDIGKAAAEVPGVRDARDK